MPKPQSQELCEPVDVDFLNDSKLASLMAPFTEVVV